MNAHTFTANYIKSNHTEQFELLRAKVVFLHEGNNGTTALYVYILVKASINQLFVFCYIYRIG